jgi:hypothetical protein
MGPLPYEHRKLDNIEGILRAEEPRLAALFDMFARLARGEGRPPAERQYVADAGPWRELAAERRRARRHRYVALAIVLASLIAVIALGLS